MEVGLVPRSALFLCSLSFFNVIVLLSERKVHQMLVPHHSPQSHVCPRCGYLPVPITTCPSCGLWLSWPSQNAGSPCWPLAPVPRPDMTPLVVELLLNLLGIYGVGWLMLGKTGVGLVLLMGSLVVWAVLVVLAICTLGLSLCCQAPVAMVAIVCNDLLLWQTIKRNVC